MSPEIHVIVVLSARVRDGATVDSTGTCFAKFDRHGFYQRRCISIDKLYMPHKLPWLAFNYKN